jgi:hypothetical protein
MGSSGMAVSGATTSARGVAQLLAVPAQRSGTPVPLSNFSSCGMFPWSSVTCSGSPAGVEAAPPGKRALHRQVSADCAEHHDGHRGHPARAGGAQGHRQPGGGQRRHKSDAVHADPGGQRPGPAVDVGITALAPGKAGEKLDAGQLGQQPQRGEHHGARKLAGWRQPHEERAGRGVVQGQEGGQQTMASTVSGAARPP